MTDLVVGSGPSGVAVATALLARGRDVLMVDAGKWLEPQAETRRDRLAATEPAGWSASARAGYQQPQFEAPPGHVRRFGSDFAMEPAAQTLTDPDFALRSSHARGGLSNLWGAAVLPYAERDLRGWPVTAADLAPHYRAVADIMPVAGRVDALQTLFGGLPLSEAPPLTAQAEKLRQRLDAAEARLASLGITAGAARIAVAPGCRACGMCLHGCPWRLIWSGATALRMLLEHPGFDYRPGQVRAFTEDPQRVILHLDGGDTVEGARLFLATGVLETARLVMATGNTALQSLRLRDSQHGFLPLLHRWLPDRRPDRLPNQTLPQHFVEIDAPAVSPWLVHAQLYGWNEFYAPELAEKYGRFAPGSQPLWRALARRLIVAQIFLHSDHSAHITLRRAGDGRLDTQVETRPATASILRNARRHLARGLRHAGLVALGAAARAGAPGSSFHCGATLPMASDPQGAQSDGLGRPAGLARVHIVDASVLPAIPATTITYSVMANAHRIGSLAP